MLFRSISVSTAVGQTDLLLSFLGITELDQIFEADTQAYRDNLDMLDLMDAADAPLYVENVTPSPQNLVDLLFHHGLHGRALAEQADAVGLSSVVYVTDPFFTIQDPSGEDHVSFLSRHIR